MKKNMIIAAAVLASAVACTKEIEEPSALDGKVQMSFAVSTEQTKTVLEGANKTFWTGVEKLSIFDGESNNLFAAELATPSATAEFTGKAATAQTYYALYPYNSAAKLSGTTVSTELPAVQTATKGTFDPSAALLFGTADGTSVSLKNLTAMLKLTVPANVTSIEVDGNGTALAGSVNVDVKSAELSGATASKVTLSGKGALEAGTYYIAVAPATVSGLSVKLIDSANSKYILRSVADARTLAANTIYDMGEFNASEWVAGSEQPKEDAQIIFDEAMQNGWIIGGTDGKYSIKDGVGKDGGKGIEWLLDASGNWARVLTFELPANTDISGYTKLCFDIEYVNSTFEATWNVFTNRVYGDGFELFYHATAPDKEGWHTVEMPLNDFTIQSGTKDWTKFKTFCFHTNGWNAGTATVHIDNVRLVKSGDSGSSEPEQPKEDAQIIFDDAMQNSWIIGGTDGKYSIKDGVGKDGGKGIEWLLDASGNWARVLTFELPANTDISGYTKLCFDIEYVNSTFEATWNVFTNRVYGDGFELFYHATAPDKEGWHTVEMPLNDFTIQSGTKDWTKFKTFCFHTNGWNAGTATVHIDNVRLVK